LWVIGGVGLMKWLANHSGVTYYPIRSRDFTGEMPPNPTDVTQWLATAQEEHETEYMDHIDVHVGLKRIVMDPRKILFGRDPDNELEGDAGDLAVERAE
jgi:hypothetical protein